MKYRFPILGKLIFPICFSVVTILILLTSTNFLKFREALVKADVKLLILASLKVPLIFLVLVLRWGQILKSRKIHVRLSHLCNAVMIGCFFNNITPGFKAGGEPMRAFYLAKSKDVDLKRVAASIAAERMLHGLSLALLVLTITLFTFFLPHIPQLY